MATRSSSLSLPVLLVNLLPPHLFLISLLQQTFSFQTKKAAMLKERLAVVRLTLTVGDILEFYIVLFTTSSLTHQVIIINKNADI